MHSLDCRQRLPITCFWYFLACVAATSYLPLVVPFLLLVMRGVLLMNLLHLLVAHPWPTRTSQVPSAHHQCNSCIVLSSLWIRKDEFVVTWTKSVRLASVASVPCSGSSDVSHLTVFQLARATKLRTMQLRATTLRLGHMVPWLLMRSALLVDRTRCRGEQYVIAAHVAAAKILFDTCTELPPGSELLWCSCWYCATLLDIWTCTCIGINDHTCLNRHMHTHAHNDTHINIHRQSWKSHCLWDSLWQSAYINSPSFWVWSVFIQRPRLAAKGFKVYDPNDPPKMVATWLRAEMTPKCLRVFRIFKRYLFWGRSHGGRLAAWRKIHGRVERGHDGEVPRLQSEFLAVDFSRS